MKLIIFLFISMVTLKIHADSTYKIIGDCDGLPRVNVLTAKGFCLGLVYENKELKKPRTAAALNSNEVIIADMGSWEAYAGKIFSLHFENGQSSLKEIFSKKSFSNPTDPRREIINRPHQITKHSDGKFYIGSSSALLRFDPLATNPTQSIEVLINNIPAEGLHPLKSFAFDDDNNLYINVGAKTNACSAGKLGGIFDRKPKLCDEAENLIIGQGQIRRYKITPDGKFNPQFEIYAKGLRNSMALAWDSKHKVLIQGENGRDAIEKSDSSLDGKELPHEEINIIEKGKHYGWPYCYDNNVVSPEWKHNDCSHYEKPHLLLPAHSSPLNFLFYKGSMFPVWYQDRLFATFHGYEKYGHRIVVFKRDDQGLPTGIPQSVVYGWDKSDTQGLGTPVSITEMPDGALLIIEDNNKKILRLAYNPNEGDGKAIQEITGVKENDHSENEKNDERNNEEVLKEKLLTKLKEKNPGPFTLFQAKVIDNSCYSCHGGVNAPGIQLARYDDEGNEMRILKANKAREIYLMIKGENGYPQMPPQGFASKTEANMAVGLLEKWLLSLKLIP